MTEKDFLKLDRKRILTFIGHNDWSVLIKKLNKPTFSDFRYKFENALRQIKVSLIFIDKYKDLKLFPSVIHNVLENKEYSPIQLIDIINKFPDYIDWYYVFYNKNIPLWFKKENYDKIYTDSLVSFDNSVPMAVRIINTKKALSILL